MAVRAITALTIALLSSSVARTARGEDELSDRWQERPNAIEVHAGFGTPVGYLGLVYDRTLWSRWSASLGFGVGSGRSGGSLHLAAGTRVRALSFIGSAVYLGFDYSTGGWRYVEVPVVPDTSYSPYERVTEPVVFAERIHWLQGSLGYELRTTAGVVLRPYFGIAFMLNPESRRCVDEVTRRPCLSGRRDYEGDVIPVYGLALGGAL
jgi:hypothetical protein